MAKEKLAPAHDWRNRELPNWNTTTFHSYFGERCVERYGISKYVPFRNWGAEKGMLKRFMDEHGKEVTKEFIDICLENYKGNANYPSLTFGFAYSYMQNPHLTKLLNKKKQLEKIQVTETPKLNTEELKDWF